MTWIPFLKVKSRHEKAAEQYRPLVSKINDLSQEMRDLSDGALQARVVKLHGQPLDDLKRQAVPLFAAVREASMRVLKMRHFDVQLIGGFSLLNKNIVEMKTGEGKTLAATLPLVLHALTGQGAHLVTVNDYLALRDAQWMKPLYEFFNLTVGVSVPGQTAQEKHAAYSADITYGTNNEFAFDYLRDNMAQSKDDLVQRGLAYAIVDEVDSILIDEARTPLIISAPDSGSTLLYDQFSRMVPQLKENTHYNIDEKHKAVTLTDDGISKVEKQLGVDNIYEERGIRFVHHLEQALRAQVLYKRDKDYVVQEGMVVIVDEFTGRLMEGRRYAEGLHQAIEAKEKVKVQQESRTLATITFQNFFRLYDALAGMTGTAVTSAEEFEKVYNLDVHVIPTNKQLVRVDKPDRIYVNEQAKFAAVVQEIKRRHQQGQPVLVGTIAIEKSEHLSALLNREGIKHEVLNAKQHAREAEIITQAGQLGAVTISTNMAGRGTDIKLGDKVAAIGGLFVLGTERHEARRIDNQLRGRSGRQGDAGETQFFVSLKDDVMRVFGGDRISNLMRRLKLPEDQPIENKMVNRALEGAQERVEGHYFDMRKQVLSYDDVLNRQRTAIYKLRRGIIMEGKWRGETEESESLHDHLPILIAEQAKQLVAAHTGEGAPEHWNIEEVTETVSALTGQSKEQLQIQLQEIVAKAAPQGPEEARERLVQAVTEVTRRRLREREEEFGDEVSRRLEEAAAIRSIDVHWMEHLDTMDYLRTGIGLRGYGQRDPLVEYQREGYQLFHKLLATIKGSIVDTVLRAQPAFARESTTGAIPAEQQTSGGQEGSVLHQLAGQTAAAPGKRQNTEQTAVGDATSGPLKNPHKDVSRNDPCPCGSGKKFKKCHGR